MLSTGHRSQHCSQSFTFPTSGLDVVAVRTESSHQLWVVTSAWTKVFYVIHH